MKRMHIHVSVKNIDESARFYSAMFGVAPTVQHRDYAKWQLEDPRVNFAISSQAGNALGVNHLGIQAESGEELAELYRQLGDASYQTLQQTGAKCCYAESDKHWATDPTGVAWEMFHTMREITVYGSDRAMSLDRDTDGDEGSPATDADGCCAA